MLGNDNKTLLLRDNNNEEGETNKSFVQKTIDNKERN